MPKLTKNFVATAAPPDTGQIIYRDTVVLGLGLRVTRGSRSYIVEARANGVLRRITLGKDSQLTPTEARKKARKLLAAMASGKDPTLEKARRKLKGVTLHEVLEHYLTVRILRANTIRSYRYVLPRCLGDWLDLPVVAISREMIEQRHLELRRTTRQGTTGEAQANSAMHILSALLNFAAANYEIDGKPIIVVNPVKRLSNNRRWYPEHRRQGVVPDHKLPDWFASVFALKHHTVKDYLLLMLLTGLRRNEAATLKWTDIDFASRVLTVRAEIAKNGHELRLPLSNYLERLLQDRFARRGDSLYVFPGHGKKLHLVDSKCVIEGVAKTIGYRFTPHDLRRTFLTVAERLSLSYVVLKKLANHSGRSDTTFGYIIVDVERLREPMQRITDEFLRLGNVKTSQNQVFNENGDSLAVSTQSIHDRI